MDGATHVILRSRVEVAIADRKQEKAIRARIHAWMEQTFLPHLERCLSEYAPHGVVLHMEQLTIDVGRVDPAALLQQLPHQIEQSLRAALQERVAQVVRNPTPKTVVALPEATLQALAHYLSEGTKAWWMTQNSEQEVVQRYRSMQERHPFALERMWHSLDKQEQAVRRFATRFETTLVEQTLGLLCKQPTHAVGSLLSEISPLFQETSLLPKRNGHQELLATALLGVLRSNKAVRNRVDFAALLLQQIASKQSMACEAVALQLLQTQGKHPSRQPAPATTHEPLAAVLQHLCEKSLLAPAWAHAERANTPNFVRQLDRLAQGAWEPHRLGGLLRKLEKQLATNPALRQVLRNWLQEPRNRIRLIKQLPHPYFSAFVAALDVRLLPCFTDWSQLLAALPEGREWMQTLQEATLTHCTEQAPPHLYATAVLRTVCDKGNVSTQRLRDWMHASAAHPSTKSAIGDWLNAKTEQPDGSMLHAVEEPKATEVAPAGAPAASAWIERLAFLARDVGNNVQTKMEIEAILLETWLACPLRERPPTAAHLLQAVERPNVARNLQRMASLPDGRKRAALTELLQGLLRATLYALPLEPAQERQQEASGDLGQTNANPTKGATPNKQLLKAAAERVVALLHRSQEDHLVDPLPQPSEATIASFFAERYGQGQLLQWTAETETLPAEQREEALQAFALRTAAALQASHLLPRILEKKVLDRAPGACSIETVVDFLVHDQLPPDKPIAAYWIAKSIAQTTPELLARQLAPLCQDEKILQKLLLHATEASILRLMEAWIPFPNRAWEPLEAALLQTEPSLAGQLTERFVRELLLRAALVPRAPANERDFLQRVVHHASAHTGVAPGTLCAQLATCAKQRAWHPLEAACVVVQKRLALLDASALTKRNLRLLPTHEAVARHLDAETFAQYYNRVVPALEALAEDPTVSDGACAVAKLATNHLPTLAAPVQQAVCDLLAAGLAGEKPQKRLHGEWECFVRTGYLGSYADANALLAAAMQAPTVPFLAQAVRQVHVRQRLIASFSHAQLLQLAQKETQEGLPHLADGYALWRSTTPVESTAKESFWEAALQLLPEAPFDGADWMEPLLAKLGAALRLPSETLLQSFLLLRREMDGLSPTVRNALHRLQQQSDRQLQETAKHEATKAPILASLQLLLQGKYATVLCSEMGGKLPQQALEMELGHLTEGQPELLRNALIQQPHKAVAARRLVYYLSASTCKNMASLLAHPNSAGVEAHCDLVHRLSIPAALEKGRFDQWKKEWMVALLTHLLEAPNAGPEQAWRAPWKEPFVRQYLPLLLPHLRALRSTNPTEQAALKQLLFALETDKSTGVTESLQAVPAPPDEAKAHPSDPPNGAKRPNPFEPPKPVEAVRLQVQSAGLVFLCPFLCDFFKSHALLSGNRFVSEQALHNGAYLLHYAATGRIEGPEWEFVLPKLLCGLPYDAVLLPYLPMHEKPPTEAEEEATQRDHGGATTDEKVEEKPSDAPESETTSPSPPTEANPTLPPQEQRFLDNLDNLLLEKVFNRWTSLQDFAGEPPFEAGITPSTFKRYFLRRLGILFRHAYETSDGYFWHLTLVHEPYDTVALLPPWSMDTIKLPWMQEELVLFWMPQ